MEGTKAFIRFRKANGELGPGQMLEINQSFIIGSETGCDIRLHKTSRPIRYIFQLNESGLVTVTEFYSASAKNVFTNSENFQIEGKTFFVEYLYSTDVTSPQTEASLIKKNRFSCAPKISMEKNKIVPDLKAPIEYLNESEFLTKQPKCSSITSESDDNNSTSSMLSVQSSRNTPSCRRSILRRPSMIALPEEDESNSNDSKYKTPENTTPMPKIVMRSHKSVVKLNIDGESTPRCVTPLSNIKSRRSLILHTDLNTFKDLSCVSPNASDDEMSEKGGLTITTTSESDSGTEFQVSILDNSNEDRYITDVGDRDIVVEELDDTNLNIRRQTVKRGRNDVDSEENDEAEQVVEPPKKRMKRDNIHSFPDQRTPSIAESDKRDFSLHSKKSMEYAKTAGSTLSLTNTSQSVVNTSRSMIDAVPNTVPRLKNKLRQYTLSAVQSKSRKSLPAVLSAKEDEDNIIFQKCANISVSPEPQQKEFPMYDEANDSDTTQSSSFDYIHGKDVELTNLEMSIFSNDENDLSANIAERDLIDFSLNPNTPDKHAIASSDSHARRSGRIVKPPKVYTPDHPTIGTKSPNTLDSKNTTTPPLLANETSLLINISSVNNSTIRKSSRPLTPTSFPDYILHPLTPRRKARIEASVEVNNTSTMNDDARSKPSNNKSRRNSNTPAKIPRNASPRSSEVGKNVNVRTPLSPRSLQKNPVAASITNLDTPFEGKRRGKKGLRTPKENIARKTSATFDSDDSFFEFRENTRAQTPSILNKRADLSSVANINTHMSAVHNSTPITLESNKFMSNISATKSTHLLEQSVPVRRSNRTPKSVFCKNSILDESIFDTSTSTKQSHSISRSLSRSKSFPLKDDSLNNAKDVSTVRPVFGSSSSFIRSISVGNINFLEQAIAKKTTSTINDLTNVEGVKKLMRISKVQNEPKNDLRDVRGVAKLLKTPKPIKAPKNELSDLRGVKNMFKTPKVSGQPKNDLRDVQGVYKLMKSPKQYKEPLNDLSDLKGVKKLMRTPKEMKPVKDDLTNVAGVKRIFGTPKVNKEPKNDLSDVFGLKKLMRTPKSQKSHVPDFNNVSGVGSLFDMNENDSDEVIVTTTSSMVIKNAKGRRGRAQSIETEEEVVTPKRTRSKKLERLPAEKTLVIVKEPSARRRPVNRNLVVQEVEEVPTPSPKVAKVKKRSDKKQVETIEQVQKPVQTKKRYTRKRVALQEEEVPANDIKAQQMEDVSLTIIAKGVVVSRKRGINTRNAAAETVKNDVEPLVKRIRGRPKSKEDAVIVKKTEASPKKTRSKATKSTATEEVENTQAFNTRTMRKRKQKTEPVQNLVEDDTSVEEIAVEAPSKAVRVTRTRRGRGTTKQTEESHEVESTENLTKVVVKKSRSTKQVQFDAEVAKSSPAVRTNKRPKTRRLLTIDDIDEMCEDVAPSTRKSLRSRK